ncbi:MAG: RtcB family protein [Candidatus Woesearchaeota archaeon]
MKIRKLKEDIYEIKKEGKMNVPVKIFASESIMEVLKRDRALEQGINVAHLPGIVKHSIMMPDAHQGYGFPIGGVAAIDYENGCISPGGIGFDINCGVRLLVTPFFEKDMASRMGELLESIYNHVPVGLGGESKLKLEFSDVDDILTDGARWALDNGYASQDDLDHCEEGGMMLSADSSKVSHKAKARGRKQLGTLGAGNHFIEVQKVNEVLDDTTASAFGLMKDQIVVMIHCGSRGLGHQVCTDYIRVMEQSNPGLMESLPEKDLIYAESGTQAFDDYFGAMSSAANFAWANRQLISYHVREAFKDVFKSDHRSIKLLYDVSHNIAKLEKHKVDGEMRKLLVHRKGATRAFAKGREELKGEFKEIGQPIIIPGSMGTRSYVLLGTDEAMKTSFGSTAHGAGRKMSRHKAKQTFTYDKVNDDLKNAGVMIKARSQKGITEEAPGVYKDVDEVVKVSDTTGIGKLVASLRPLGVIKG